MVGHTAAMSSTFCALIPPYLVCGFRYLTEFVCRLVFNDLHGVKTDNGPRNAGGWRLPEDYLAHMLKISLQMTDYIDSFVQRRGWSLVQCLARVTTDTTLRWHKATILFAIEYVSSEHCIALHPASLKLLWCSTAKRCEAATLKFSGY